MKPNKHPVKGVNTDISGNPIISNQQAHWSNQPIFNMPIYKPTNYKEMEAENKRLRDVEAKHKALEQGVKDAIVEMESAHQDCYINSPNPLESQAAYKHSIQLLKEKTNYETI